MKRSRILREVHETATAMHRAGAIDRQTMREFDALTALGANRLKPRAPAKTLVAAARRYRSSLSRNRAKNKHGTKHMTPPGRSALRDLATSDEDAVELQMRSTLIRGLECWLASSDLTQIEAAKALAITKSRFSDLKRGKISQFRLDMLIRLATRAGLRPTLKLAA